ncbi:MAG: MFS transporter, partial [Fimbriimonadaceae bacterium]
MKARPLWLIVLLLAVGYSGFYLCRSSFSVAKPLLLEAFPSLDKAKLGLIASVGTLLYAIGKLIHGPLADKIGGKPLFLYGMLGAIGFSLMFGLGGPPLFMVAWAGNRFVQSSGWPGMVRIAGQWASRHIYGRVMAFVSLSYLFGDFASRLLLGYWVNQKVGWAGLFTYSAFGLILIFVPVAFLLRERPGYEMAPPLSEVATAQQMKSIFLRSDFWMVCILSFCVTLLRETFNEWTPTYLTEFAKMAKGDAGQASSIFPLFGGLSVLVVGFLGDRVARSDSPSHRLKVIPTGLLVSGVLMAGLAFIPGLSPLAIVILVGAVAFALIGPYSLLAGATSLDFGGGQSAATASGWIDGIGYFGGIVSGLGVGQIAQHWGWSTAMGVLAGL